MSDENVPLWLNWGREIQAISQTGIAYSKNIYDTQRYKRLMGIAAEIFSLHPGFDKDSLKSNFLTQVGYATPKVEIRGAVVENNKILLVQEASDGQWCMPGGWADVGQTPSSVVVREVREESGLEVQPIKVIGIYDNNRNDYPTEIFHSYKIVFLCNITSWELTTGIETLSAKFFRFDDNPPLSKGRTNKRHIIDAYSHFQNQNLLTIFD